jgi:hypothetical protein
MLKNRSLLGLLLVLILAPMTLAGTAHASEGGGEKKRSAGAEVVQLRTINVNVLNGSQVRTVITLEVSIYVVDPKLLERAKSMQPRLQAAFGQILQAYMTGLPAGTIPNADQLSQRLQTEADRIIGQRGGKLLMGSIIIN